MATDMRWRQAARYLLAVGLIYGGTSGAAAYGGTSGVGDASAAQRLPGHTAAAAYTAPGGRRGGHSAVRHTQPAAHGAANHTRPGTTANRKGPGTSVRPPNHGTSVVVLVPPYAVYAISPAQTYRATANRHAPKAPGLAPALPRQTCPSAPVVRRYRIGVRPSSLPAAVDLSRFDPPVADEGPVRAGVAWATGYTVLGWWAARSGLAVGPFAPMSVYARVARGQNRPVTLADTLALEQHAGIATQADYRHSSTDYRHLPTRAERASAAQYRLAGFSCVYARGRSHISARTAIKAVLAAGQPLVVGVPAYDNLLAASVSKPYVDLPPRGSRLHGAEAVVAVKYDSNGVWVENEWGAAWGLRGYAELSWRFVNTYTLEAWVVGVAWQAPQSPVIAVTATALAGLGVQPTITGTPTYPFTGTSPYPISETQALTPCLPGVPAYPAAVYTPTLTVPPATSPTATPVAPAAPTASASVASQTATPQASGPCSSNESPDALQTALSAYPTVPPFGGDYGSSGYPPLAFPTIPDAGSLAAPPDVPTYPADLFAYLGDLLSTPTATPPVTTTPSPTTTVIPSATLLPTATPSPSVTPTPSQTAVPPQLVASPMSGPVGTTITLTLTGFGAASVAITWSNPVTLLGYVAPTGDSFTVTIVVPASAVPGTATITCVNIMSGANAVATFKVTPPSTASPTVTAAATPTGTAMLTSTPTPTGPTPTATATNSGP